MATESSLDFPGYSVAWLANETILVGGGGGSAKTGQHNSLQLLALDTETLACRKVRTIELGADDDAVMALDARGGLVAAGINDNATADSAGASTPGQDAKARTGRSTRVFAEDAAAVANSIQCGFRFANEQDYVRVVRFKRDGSALAMGSTAGDFSVLAMPDAQGKTVHLDEAEIYDVDFSVTSGDKNDDVIFATAESVNCGKLTQGKNGLSFLGYSPIVDFSGGGATAPSSQTIRGARFAAPDMLVLLVNLLQPGRRRQAELHVYQAAKGRDRWQRVKRRRLHRLNRGGTCFDLAEKVCAVGLADCSVAVCSTRTLKEITTHRVHTFPITACAFSPNGEYLASTSVDGKLVVMRVPEDDTKQRPLETILMGLVVLLLALLLAVVYYGEGAKQYAKLHAMPSQAPLGVPDVYASAVTSSSKA